LDVLDLRRHKHHARAPSRAPEPQTHGRGAGALARFVTRGDRHRGVVRHECAHPRGLAIPRREAQYVMREPDGIITKIQCRIAAPEQLRALWTQPLEQGCAGAGEGMSGGSHGAALLTSARARKASSASSAPGTCATASTSACISAFVLE